jgi:hypothetical protein
MLSVPPANQSLFRAIKLSQFIDLCPRGENGQTDQQYNVEMQEKLSPNCL